MNKKIKIILHDHAGHPYSLLFGRALAQKGYTILYCYRGDDITPHGNMENSDSERFRILPITTGIKFNKYSFVNRFIQEILYGFKFKKIIDNFKPDIVFSVSTPIFSQKIILNKCNRLEIKFVHWWTDITSLTAKEIFKKKLRYLSSLLTLIFINVEKYIVKNSSEVIITTESHRKLALDWGANNRNIFLIHLWAPLAEYPVQSKINEWSISKGFDKTFNFIFTGTMGFKHNPSVLLKLAEEFKNFESVRIIVVSESIGAKWLESKRIESNISNLIILGFQPYSDIPLVMGSADVLIALVDNEVGDYAVPSKVLSYLCAERAILLSIDKNNLAAKILLENKAGIVVNPNDSDSFLEQAKKLYNNIDLRQKVSQNARKYAETDFNMETIIKKFEKIILE